MSPSESVLARRMTTDGGEGDADAADESMTLPDDEEDANEMMQIAPEVQMFLGNHFLADSEAKAAAGLAGDASKGDSKTSKDSANASPSNGVADPNKANRFAENGGIPSSSGGDAGSGSNGTMKHMSHQMGMAAAAAAAAHHGVMMGGGEGQAPPELDSRYSCRLCGKVSGNGASLFAHLLYPHYAHLWRDDVPHRAPRYDCKECSYSTVKRQHFVMHVARVHDELRKKLAVLGENLEVLDNLTQKSQGASNERIVSKIAKGIDEAEASASFGGLGRNSPVVQSGSSSPNAKEFFNSMSNDKGSPFPTPNMLGAYDHMRVQRGFKPFVKCRLCGKSWKGKDNFFTHLVSTHFKYLWAKEVPRSADMYHCHVPGCSYQSKYRYNFLFHLAGKHKQLKQKLAEEGIPENVLTPIETDGSEFADEAGAFPGAEEAQLANANALLAAGMAAGSPQDLMRQSKMLMQRQQQQQQRGRAMTTPPSALKGSGGRPSSSNSNNTRLICRVCSKVSLNHTCHRQHVVGKHFYEFWANLSADGMGIFNCHHPDCTYKTPNRSVFIIHLAYVHQELKNKLIASGKDPSCITPDVYGKRKYRRQYYDNTQHRVPVFPDPASLTSPSSAMAAAAAAAQRDISSLVSQQQAEVLKQLASQFGNQFMGNGFPPQMGESPASEGSGNELNYGGERMSAGDMSGGEGPSGLPGQQVGEEEQLLPHGVDDVGYDDDLAEEEDDDDDDGAEEEDEEMPPAAAQMPMHHGMMPPAAPQYSMP